MLAQLHDFCTRPLAVMIWVALSAAVKAVCGEYRAHNADVYMREDCDIDDLVDVIEGSRIYIPCIYAVNKIVRPIPEPS